ncbi:hypothetical protein TNCV_1689691 [Trichonephila clavipes]|nr:hypothetical protein TNCV_1689691 [Trichonephila clavipes]
MIDQNRKRKQVKSLSFVKKIRKDEQQNTQKVKEDSRSTANGLPQHEQVLDDDIQEKMEWLEHLTPDRKACVRCPMPPNALRVHADLHAEIVEVEIEVVSPSIVPSGNSAELNRTVTCTVLKTNDRRTSSPCHDEFRGPRSDYVRQVALEKQQQILDKKEN